VNLMLVRGDDIVLLPEIVLDRNGKQAVAAKDYRLVVTAFSAFTEKSLVQLLEDPVKQFFPAVPKVPDINDDFELPSTPEPHFMVANESVDKPLTGDHYVPTAPIIENAIITKWDALPTSLLAALI